MVVLYFGPTCCIPTVRKRTTWPPFANVTEVASTDMKRGRYRLYCGNFEAARVGVRMPMQTFYYARAPCLDHTCFFLFTCVEIASARGVLIFFPFSFQLLHELFFCITKTFFIQSDIIYTKLDNIHFIIFQKCSFEYIHGKINRSIGII